MLMPRVRCIVAVVERLEAREHFHRVDLPVPLAPTSAVFSVARMSQLAFSKQHTGAEALAGILQ